MLDTFIKNTPNGFIDIEHYDGISFDKDGYFYTIDYKDSDFICEQNNRCMLLTVYRIRNSSRYCPYRVDVFIEGNTEKFMWINHDSRERLLLFSHNTRTGEISNGDIDFSKITLSDLIESKLCS